MCRRVLAKIYDIQLVVCYIKYTVPKLSLKLYEAYRVCRKEPDWSNDVPPVTTAAPTTPEANPTTVASTESPITDVPITNAPIEDLPDFNDLS